MQVKTTVGGVFSPSVNGMIFLENNILEKLFLNINDKISIMIAWPLYAMAICIIHCFLRYEQWTRVYPEYTVRL